MSVAYTAADTSVLRPATISCHARSQALSTGSPGGRGSTGGTAGMGSTVSACHADSAVAGLWSGGASECGGGVSSNSSDISALALERLHERRRGRGRCRVARENRRRRDLLAVGLFVVVAVRLEDAARQVDAGEESLRARVGQDLGVHLRVGRGARVA